MAGHTEFGEFLSSRRSRLTPGQAGLAPKPGTRRVPGLRREEVAELASLSVDYYVRLERGRATHPSADVLDAIARALRLDEAERAHLFDLARVTPPGRRRRRPPQRPHPGLLRTLETLDHVPAMIVGRRTDVLAANRMLRALLTDFDARPPRQRNVARYMFLDPDARVLYRDWAEVAETVVYGLRMNAGRDPDDALLTELVGELTVADPDFSRWWSTHDVRRRAGGTKHFRHPVVGNMTLRYDRLSVPDTDDQHLSVYTAESGSRSAEALRLLGDWSLAPAARNEEPSRDR